MQAGATPIPDGAPGAITRDQVRDGSSEAAGLETGRRWRQQVVGPERSGGAGLLPEDAPVDTVDKFEGQAAPIVLYSMATSSPEVALRGMKFLFAADRLNVTTSRARCLAVVVAEPASLRPAYKSTRQMWLADGYCRVGDVAG